MTVIIQGEGTTAVNWQYTKVLTSETGGGEIGVSSLTQSLKHKHMVNPLPKLQRMEPC